MEIEQKNVSLLGALISVLIIILCISIFIFRMSDLHEIEYFISIVFLLTFFPLAYLFQRGKKNREPIIYFVQLGTMILFLFVELLLDYILVYPFREVKWMSVLYVILFFAGTGGMIGIASKAGKIWSIIAILLFFNMAALAFMQHAKTMM